MGASLLGGRCLMGEAEGERDAKRRSSLLVWMLWQRRSSAALHFCHAESHVSHMHFGGCLHQKKPRSSSFKGS